MAYFRPTQHFKPLISSLQLARRLEVANAHALQVAEAEHGLPWHRRSRSSNLLNDLDLSLAMKELDESMRT